MEYGDDDLSKTENYSGRKMQICLKKRRELHAKKYNKKIDDRESERI